MVHLIDKKDCQFDNIFCHKIIQYRNKFLIDNQFPKSSSISLFPKCHLPINFINNINDEIFEKLNNNLLKEISERYNVKKEYLDLNIVFYVENSYQQNSQYVNFHCEDYSYGFVLSLNEDTMYFGGDICIDNIKINTNNNIVLFTDQDELKITEILTGEQHKLIGYISYKLKKNNDSQQYQYFYKNTLPIVKKQNYVHFFKNLIDHQQIGYIYDVFSLENIRNKNLESKFTFQQKNDVQSFRIDHIDFIDLIINLKGLLYQNSRFMKILSNYHINFEHILFFKIKILKKDSCLHYFSPVIKTKDEILDNQTESKFTLLIKLNKVPIQVFFPNQELKYEMDIGDSLLVPNCFLYPYYIEIMNNLGYLYFLEICFF